MKYFPKKIERNIRIFKERRRKQMDDAYMTFTISFLEKIRLKAFKIGL